MSGKDKIKARATVFDNVLPEFLHEISINEIEQWLIGDGERIYLCDFFVGAIYADIFSNIKCWISDNEKEYFLMKWPKFKAYGERFNLENKAWLEKREKATGKYTF